jgi:hypothetical protein
MPRKRGDCWVVSIHVKWQPICAAAKNGWHCALTKLEVDTVNGQEWMALAACSSIALNFSTF